MATTRTTIVSITGSILGAAALWLYVSLTRTYEGDVIVPLVTIPPPGQSIVSNVPKFITVHVRTSGLNLLNMTYYNKPQSCSLAVAQTTVVGPDEYAVSSAELLRRLSDVVPSRMLSAIPSELTIRTGTPEQTKVPLTIPYTIVPRQGFVLVSPPSAQIQAVTIKGMRSVVQSITQWSTKKILIDDAHEKVYLDVPVSDSLSSLVDVNPKTVRVHVDIQREADQEIADVPVQLVGQALADGIVVRPSHIRVTVRGGVDNIRSVSRDDLEVTVENVSASGYVIPVIRTQKNVGIVNATPRLIQCIKVQR